MVARGGWRKNAGLKTLDFAVGALDRGSSAATIPKNVKSSAKRTRMGDWPLVRRGTVIVCCRVRKRAGKDIVVGVSVSRNKREGGKEEEFRYRYKNAE